MVPGPPDGTVYEPLESFFCKLRHLLERSLRHAIVPAHVLGQIQTVSKHSVAKRGELINM